MKSLFMKHEYFISKSTNETKHSRNVSSAGIKYSYHLMGSQTSPTTTSTPNMNA